MCTHIRTHTHTHRKHSVNTTSEAVKENSHEHWRLELNRRSADLWQRSLLVGRRLHLGGLNGSAAARTWLTNRGGGRARGGSPTSGWLGWELGAKWSVFPVNLWLLNPVKLRAPPKSRPADLAHNTEFRQLHASVCAALCEQKTVVMLVGKWSVQRNKFSVVKKCCKS